METKHKIVVSSDYDSKLAINLFQPPGLRSRQFNMKTTAGAAFYNIETDNKELQSVLDVNKDSLTPSNTAGAFVFVCLDNTAENENKRDAGLFEKMLELAKKNQALLVRVTKVSEKDYRVQLYFPTITGNASFQKESVGNKDNLGQMIRSFTSEAVNKCENYHATLAAENRVNRNNNKLSFAEKIEARAKIDFQFIASLKILFKNIFSAVKNLKDCITNTFWSEKKPAADSSGAVNNTTPAVCTTVNETKITKSRLFGGRRTAAGRSTDSIESMAEVKKETAPAIPH